jgi:hypothetical protein
MPPLEAGYTYAVEPAANDRLLANEEESIYGHSGFILESRLATEAVLRSSSGVIEGFLWRKQTLKIQKSAAID